MSSVSSCNVPRRLWTSVAHHLPYQREEGRKGEAGTDRMKERKKERNKGKQRKLLVLVPQRGSINNIVFLALCYLDEPAGQPRGLPLPSYSRRQRPQISVPPLSPKAKKKAEK